jgi:hypothetical protein
MITAESKFYVKDGERQIHYKDFIFEAVKTTFSETGILYQDDLYFVYPFTNQALALLSGIECAYFGKNFLSAAILTRSLIDCVMSLVYMTQVSTNDYRAFIDEFQRSGELTKNTAKGRKPLTGKDLTKVFQKNTGANLSESYKQLSKMVHSTIFHIHANTKMIPNTESDFEIAFVGEKLEYPQRFYDELKDIVAVCIDTIVRLLESRCT